MNSRHPSESELALLAGGDCGRARGFILERHIRRCSDCAARLGEFATLRGELLAADGPEVSWENLMREMRANIRLGLEAGECVRAAALPRAGWNPRIAVAFASLLILIGTGVFLSSEQYRHKRGSATPAVLQSSAEGVAVRAGENTLELLNHTGSVADQTVGAQGQIGMRYVDDTGAVTINNVYLQ